MKCKQKKVQWQYLPDDIWNLIFLEYCDFDSLENTRFLQTEFVKECTEWDSINMAIYASNLKNMKWIYQRDKIFEWKSFHFGVAVRYYVFTQNLE